MTDNRNLFDGKASLYAKYRPGYPTQIIDLLKEEAGFNQDWVVADIGSGTGILSDLFLVNGNIVYCVEPNDDMRSFSLQRHSSLKNCITLNRTAENTGLEDKSVDIIVAGQSFHWFDPVMAKKEFSRILKPGGYVSLIWNNRSNDENSLSKGFDQVCEKFSHNYHGTGNTRIFDETFNSFFNREFKMFKIPNMHEMDLDGLIGRYLSASYSLKLEDADYEKAISSLKKLYRRFENNGKVIMEYETQVFLGTLNK